MNELGNQSELDARLVAQFPTWVKNSEFKNGRAVNPVYEIGVVGDAIRFNFYSHTQPILRRIDRVGPELIRLQSQYGYQRGKEEIERHIGTALDRLTAIRAHLHTLERFSDEVYLKLFNSQTASQVINNNEGSQDPRRYANIVPGVTADAIGVYLIEIERLRKDLETAAINIHQQATQSPSVWTKQEERIAADLMYISNALTLTQTVASRVFYPLGWFSSAQSRITQDEYKNMLLRYLAYLAKSNPEKYKAAERVLTQSVAADGNPPIITLAAYGAALAKYYNLYFSELTNE